MGVQFINPGVGARGLDDKKKKHLKGAIIKPESRSERLIIFQAGIHGYYKDYIEHFAKILGQEVNVYVGQLRHKGFGKAQTLVNDLVQLDIFLRDHEETDKVVYVGHSMGASIAAKTHNDFATDIKGLYGIATYPSYGDCFNANPNPKEHSLLERTINAVGKKSGWGPLAFPLRDIQIKVPSRFAIGGSDEVVYTRNPKKAERFKRYFEGVPKSSSKVFDKKTHCFNHRQFDFTPFNKDNPKELVNDLLEFTYSVT